MASLQNVNYYKSFLFEVQNFAANAKVKNETEAYFRPDKYLINPISRFATTRFILPALKKSYFTLANGTIFITKIFNSSIAQWVDDAWYDPISTTTLLKIGKSIRCLSKIGACQDLIRIPFLRSLHICSIVFFRYVYVFSTDICIVLSIPQSIRSYLNWSTLDMDTDLEPKTYLGHAWKWVKLGTRVVIDAILYLICKVVSAAAIPFKYIPLANSLVNGISQGLERVRHLFHLMLVQRAHAIIDCKEKSIRRKVIGAVAEATCHKTIELSISLALRGALSYGIYKGMKWSSVELLGNHDLPDQVAKAAYYGIAFLGGYLWIRCITPTLYNVYSKYKAKFDPNAMTLLQLASFIASHKLGQIVQTIQSKF